MDHIRQTVETFVEKVEQQERDLQETKKTVNLLLKALGEPPRYNLEPEPNETPIAHGDWRSDEFYGQSLTGVVRKILLARKAANMGAAPVNDIYAAMKDGGYDFGNQDEESAKHGLRASLRKNTAAFHRLPSGQYGLKEWYPHAKERKTNGVNEVKDDDDNGDAQKITTQKVTNKEHEDASQNGKAVSEAVPF